MANITRDRGCLYYIPWIATLCVAFAAASLAIWVQYTKTVRDYTLDGLAVLNVQARHVDRVNDSLLATSITYLVILTLIYLMSLWRSFIEAAHDATGVTTGAALAFLVVAYLLLTGWFLVLFWLVLLLMGNSLWVALLYLFWKAIGQSLLDIAKWGTATWLPSDNRPCPGQCFDLTKFVFISWDFQDACICDEETLSAAQYQFNQAYDKSSAVLTGNWVMLVSGICLLVNFACQYSHTKRERELLSRVNTKVYSTLG